MRHGLLTEYDPGPGVSIATLAYEYPPGFLVPEHCHGSDQVIYATRGVMQVSAGAGYWMIPPQFAIWIPAFTLHRIRMPRAVSMRTLYLRRGVAAPLPAGCTVLHVTPLLRELIVETVRLGNLRARHRLESALRDVLIAQLHKASPVPTFVTMPRDSRAWPWRSRCSPIRRHARPSVSCAPRQGSASGPWREHSCGRSA